MPKNIPQTHKQLLDQHGLNAIHHLVIGPPTDYKIVIQKMLKNDPLNLEKMTTDGNRFSPFLICATVGNFEAAKILMLNFHCNYLCRDLFKRSFAQICFAYGQIEILVEMLLDHEISELTGWTFEYAIKEGLSMLDQHNKYFKFNNQADSYISLRTARSIRRFLDISIFHFNSEQESKFICLDPLNIDEFYKKCFNIFCEGSMIENGILDKFNGVRMAFYELVLLFYIGITEGVLEDLNVNCQAAGHPETTPKEICQEICKFIKADLDVISYEENLSLLAILLRFLLRYSDYNHEILQNHYQTFIQILMEKTNMLNPQEPNFEWVIEIVMTSLDILNNLGIEKDHFMVLITTTNRLLSDGCSYMITSKALDLQYNYASTEQYSRYFQNKEFLSMMIGYLKSSTLAANLKVKVVDILTVTLNGRLHVWKSFVYELQGVSVAGDLIRSTMNSDLDMVSSVGQDNTCTETQTLIQDRQKSFVKNGSAAAINHPKRSVAIDSVDESAVAPQTDLISPPPLPILEQGGEPNMLDIARETESIHSNLTRSRSFVDRSRMSQLKRENTKSSIFNFENHNITFILQTKLIRMLWIGVSVAH